MNHDIYEMHHPPEVQGVLNEMRDRISKGTGFGVTLVGNRFTVRWSDRLGAELKQVHMLILEVDDSLPEEEEIEK